MILILQTVVISTHVIEKEKIDTAIKMINRGIDNVMITEFTELTSKHIDKLRESLQS